MTYLVDIFVVAAPVIGVAGLVFFLLFTFLNYTSATSGRGLIVFKAVAATILWILASCGWLYMFFAMIYGIGSFVNLDGETGQAVSILLLDLIYAAIGCGLGFWVRRKPDKS